MSRRGSQGSTKGSRNRPPRPRARRRERSRRSTTSSQGPSRGAAALLGPHGARQEHLGGSGPSGRPEHRLARASPSLYTVRLIGIEGSITGAQTPRPWPHCSKKLKREGTRAAAPRAFPFTVWRFMHMRAGRSLFRPFSGHPDLKYTYCFYAHVHEIIKSRNKIKYMFIIAYEIAY